MMTHRSAPTQVAPDNEELAAQAYARRRLGQSANQWTEADESELNTRLTQDPAYADAFRRVEQSWAAMGQLATSAELMGLREQALARARRAKGRRWLASGMKRRPLLRLVAVVASIGIALMTAFQLAPFGLKPGEYGTRIGEQRVVELEDHSRIALDAATRLRVRFSNDARIVQLIQGQAQFSVAKDPARPFKVEAGTHTIVAVGTVFTVDYMDREMRVAMLEGKVAVLPQLSMGTLPVEDNLAQQQPLSTQATLPARAKATAAGQSDAGHIELTAGEELRVRGDGRATVTPKADLEAATAWRNGKVIFHAEPLSEAVRRLNRYLRLQMEIADPTLASLQISGVFEEGDAQAFVEALQSYLRVTADESDSGVIRLRMRQD